MVCKITRQLSPAIDCYQPLQEQIKKLLYFSHDIFDLCCVQDDCIRAMKIMGPAILLWKFDLLRFHILSN